MPLGVFTIRETAAPTSGLFQSPGSATPLGWIGPRAITLHVLDIESMDPEEVRRLCSTKSTVFMRCQGSCSGCVSFVMIAGTR